MPKSPTPRAHGKYIPIVSMNGQEWLEGVVLGSTLGASQPVVSLVTQVTVAGSTAPVISFETEFGVVFADTNYTIELTNSVGQTRPVGYTSKAATGFTVAGTTTNGDVISIRCTGKLATQP